MAKKLRGNNKKAPNNQRGSFGFRVMSIYNSDEL